jgi:hypothetical protein
LIDIEFDSPIAMPSQLSELLSGEEDRLFREFADAHRQYTGIRCAFFDLESTIVLIETEIRRGLLTRT